MFVEIVNRKVKENLMKKIKESRKLSKSQNQSSRGVLRK